MFDLLWAVPDKVNTGIIVVDCNQEIVIWNQWLTRLTGKSRDQVVGWHLTAVCPRLGEKKYMKAINNALDAGQSRFFSGVLHGAFIEPTNRAMLQMQNMQVEPLHLETGIYAIIQITDISGQHNRVIHLKNIIKELQIDYEEAKAAEDAVLYQALHDSLTGLPNRVLCYDRLNQSIYQAQRDQHRLAVMFLDVDGFKDINDTYGHDAGDQILVDIAHRLKRCLRKTDTLARLGGDEFIVILPWIKSISDAAIVAKKILKDFTIPYQVMVAGKPQVMLTASIGISIFSKDGDTTQELIKRADAAMYEIKTSGKNGFQFS